jgi:hypothetical protein
MFFSTALLWFFNRLDKTNDTEMERPDGHRSHYAARTVNRNEPFGSIIYGAMPAYGPLAVIPVAGQGPNPPSSSAQLVSF